MKWNHNGTKYESKKVDWNEYIEEPHDFSCEDIMVYHVKWDKCYYVRRLVYKGQSIRVQLCDIYQKDKFAWSDSKYLEMVTEDKGEQDEAI